MEDKGESNPVIRAFKVFIGTSDRFKKQTEDLKNLPEVTSKLSRQVDRSLKQHEAITNKIGSKLFNDAKASSATTEQLRDAMNLPPLDQRTQFYKDETSETE
jgi:hypothetical protein